MIPTDLECQVKTMEVTVTQETVTLAMEEEEPVGLPSIETRTVETQKGNYATIDMRVLDQLGRLEVTEQGLTELVQGASQPKPALGPAEIPGMVEVELVQIAQATTSQAASSMGNQEPAGGKPSSTWRTQGEGHDIPDSESGDTQGSDDKGGDNEVPPACPNAPGAPGGGKGNGGKRGTWNRQANHKTASQEKVERDAKEEDGDSSYSVGQKDQPTQARWTTVPGTMFNGRPEVSSH